MDRSRDAPPYEGGSGGLLEIIDMMCTVTEQMSKIIKEQAIMLERAKVEESICEEFRKQRDDVDRQLDRIEYKLRRT